MSLSKALADLEATATAHINHKRALEARIKELEALCKGIGERARLASWGVAGGTGYYWLEVADREQLLAAGRGEEVQS